MNNYTKKDMQSKERILGKIALVIYSIDLTPHFLAEWRETSELLLL